LEYVIIIIIIIIIIMIIIIITTIIITIIIIGIIIIIGFIAQDMESEARTDAIYNAQSRMDMLEAGYNSMR